MEIKKLKCNKCGTDLMINPQIKHFVCTSCGSSLTIKISGNVIYTEVVKKNSKNYIDNSQIKELVVFPQKISSFNDPNQMYVQIQWNLNKNNYTASIEIIDVNGIVIKNLTSNKSE